MKDIKVLTRSTQRLQLLEDMHIYTLKDILNHIPYRYDFIEEIFLPDKVIIEGIVVDSPKVFFKGRFSRLTMHVKIHEEIYTVTIFNRHFLRQHLKIGTIITIIGTYKNTSITATNIYLKHLKELEGIHPVYSLKKGITDNAYLKYVQKALLNYEDMTYIPLEYQQKHNLINKRQAYEYVHFPKNKKQIETGIKTLKYEEFLLFQLAMQYTKLTRQQETGISKIFENNDIQDFIQGLPFDLTEDQVTVINEILEDLRQPTMMYRFLQGDVGSGKTVVSIVGLYANYLAGYQGVLLAPTEVLASQHYKNLQTFYKDTDISVGLLTGSLTLKEREDIYEKIKNNEIDIIVGTHALFQEKVIYHSLGLVITDEQQRFGVRQRQMMRSKGVMVDFLVMSATPIPRTLAMTLYGDMDVSTIHTLPSGRKQSITKYYKGKSMKPFLNALTTYLKEGGQVYVICPLIDDKEDTQLKSASQVAGAMSRYFKDYQVGLLHSQLDDEEKETIMNDFLYNKIQILVSTTVIEVGIDVRNANMMVIYDADRFGLSQLHQLRGRIGRSDVQAHCFLLSQTENEDAIERLKYLETHHDGYDISYYDLKMRGPGELLGERQSGLPTFQIGHIIEDYDLLNITRDDAVTMIQDYYKYGEYKEIIDKALYNLKENNEYID